MIPILQLYKLYSHLSVKFSIRHLPLLLVWRTLSVILSPFTSVLYILLTYYTICVFINKPQNLANKIVSDRWWQFFIIPFYLKKLNSFGFWLVFLYRSFGWGRSFLGCVTYVVLYLLNTVALEFPILLWILDMKLFITNHRFVNIAIIATKREKLSRFKLYLVALDGLRLGALFFVRSTST